MYQCIECNKDVKPDWVGTSEITHIPKAFTSPNHVVCVDCYTDECMSHPDFDHEKYTNEYEIQRDYEEPAEQLGKKIYSGQYILDWNDGDIKVRKANK